MPDPLGGLHPELVRRLGLIGASIGGVACAPQSGLRTWSDQAGLYALGRTVRNPDGPPPLGNIVTNAAPGTSWHNYGLACDVVFRTGRPGDPAGVLHWDWSGKLPWTSLGEAGEAASLEWGGRWPAPKTDLPHFELRLGLDIPAAQALYAQGGVPAVWAEVDRRLAAQVPP